MSNIDVVVTGNGTAYVDNPNPVNGDIITIYAYADPGAQLLDILMWDQNGYSIAIAVQQIQQIVYDDTWGDCTIYATFSHDIITVNTDGNGYAYVSNVTPADGETVTLYSTPNNHYVVLEIICSDSNQQVLWTAQGDTVSFTYDANWGDITIDVYFDKKWLFKNLWLLKVAQDWRFR